jgi:hypothetical protein
MYIEMTPHALDRIKNRINGISTASQIMNRIHNIEKQLTPAKCFVIVKRIPYTQIRDDSVQPDGIARGDMVVAIVENFKVTSIVLRKSRSLPVNGQFSHYIE